MKYDPTDYAFPSQPRTVDGQPDEPCFGMTLRDYFAGQWMVGYCATQTDAVWLDRSWGNVASNAYRMADAMMKARGQS